MSKIALTDDAIPMNSLILSIGLALDVTRTRGIAMQRLDENLNGRTGPDDPDYWLTSCEDLWWHNELVKRAADEAGLQRNEATFEALMQADRWPDEVRSTNYEDMPKRFVFDPWRGVGGLVRVEDADLTTAPDAVKAAIAPQIKSKAAGMSM